MIQALRGMGYTEQADHYTHFSYEMVALTPRCADELGYDISDEDKKKSYIEVSGRKGFGVKADDLIDKLIAATRAEVDARQTGATMQPSARRSPSRSPSARCATSCSSSRATPSSPSTSKTRSASRAKPAPTFSTPSCASATSSAKATPRPKRCSRSSPTCPPRISAYLSGEENEDIWSLWLRAGRCSQVLEQCIATSEPAYLAKHAFQLAQEFANFYHRHHILTEEDPARKTFLLATAAVTLRELVGSLALLGIESPEAM